MAADLQPEWTAEIAAQATKHGIDPDLLTRVIMQESGGNPSVLSKRGAVGLMQLMPATARELGVNDPYNPIQNIQGGAKYLKRLIDSFGGSVPHGLAAYNWGPGNLRKAGGDIGKAPPETQNYVAKLYTKPQAEKQAMAGSTDPYAGVLDGLDLSAYHPQAAPQPDQAADAAAVAGKPMGEVPPNIVTGPGVKELTPMQQLEALRLYEIAQAGGPRTAMEQAGAGFLSGLTSTLNNARVLAHKLSGNHAEAARADAENRIARAKDAADPRNQPLTQRPSYDNPTADAVGKYVYDKSPTAFGMGYFAGEQVLPTAATLGTGAAVGALGRGVSMGAPLLGRFLETAGEMLASGGLSRGRGLVAPDAGLAQRALGATAEAGMRVGAGAASGALNTGLVDPEHTGTGSVIGGLLPAVGIPAAQAAKFAADMTFNRQGAADRMIMDAIKNKSQVMENLHHARGQVRLGGPMTAVEAAQSPELSGLLGYTAKHSDAGARMQNALDEANAQRFLAGSALGGNAADVQAARAARSAVTDPLYNALPLGRNVGTAPVREAFQAFANTAEGKDAPIYNAVADTLGPMREVQVPTPRNGLLKRVDLATMWQSQKKLDRAATDIYRKVPLGAQVTTEDVAKLAPMEKIRAVIHNTLTNASPEFRAYSDEYARLSGPVRENSTMYRIMKDITGSKVVQHNGEVVPVIEFSKLNSMMKEVNAPGAKPSPTWTALNQGQRDYLMNLWKEMAQSQATFSKASPHNPAARQFEISHQIPAAARVAALAVPWNEARAGAGLLQLLTGGAHGSIMGRAADTLLGDPVKLEQLLARYQATGGPLTPAMQTALQQGMRMAPMYGAGAVNNQN